jgi:hypothetical protein
MKGVAVSQDVAAFACPLSVGERSNVLLQLRDALLEAEGTRVIYHAV